jgi:LAS superfamily LD-carboxypeptidase LdcB
MRVVGLLVAIAAIAAVLSYQRPASSSPTAPRTEHRADEPPELANLDADLRGALRRATAAAADDGVEIVVDSGWRSPEHQARLLREAIAKYGSEAEAARWVATPETSAHVSGDAIDIGPTSAAAWLSEHGAAYGLCQIYGNEPWHFELRSEAADLGCPPPYADPTHDPRMQE